MSSPEKEEFKIFLPSMMRKNGGKFGETLGNALMNKFTAPPGQRKSQPELVQPDTAERSTDSTEATPKPAPVEDVVDSGNDTKSSTLDQVSRQEILKDVRSNRVKGPPSRPKSLVRLLSNEVEEATKSEITQPDAKSDEKEKKTIAPSVTMPIPISNSSDIKHRQFPIRARSDRPATISNSLDAIEDSSPKTKVTDEVDSTVIGRRFAYRDRNSNLSKSSGDLLSSSPRTASVPTAIVTKPNHEKSVRALKVHAVKLTTSVGIMEKEIASMKAQLSNLITLIGEIEPSDKK